MLQQGQATALLANYLKFKTYFFFSLCAWAFCLLISVPQTMSCDMGLRNLCAWVLENLQNFNYLFFVLYISDFEFEFIDGYLDGSHFHVLFAHGRFILKVWFRFLEFVVTHPFQFYFYKNIC